MIYIFGECTLDATRHRLVRAGQNVAIEPLVFDLLHLLLRHPGRLVTRDELIAELWQGRAISDSAVSACVAAARKAVGDDGKSQAVIRTVARRGLKLVAAVENEAATAPDAPGQSVLKVRFATAGDGANLAYATHGTGPPLLRLRGPSHLELDWNKGLERAHIDAVAAVSNLLRYDLRGQGLSDPTLKRWDLDQLADDTAAVADAAGLDRFVVLGVSGEAHLAVHFAARHPRRVSRLIIQNGYVDGRALRETAGPDPLLGLIREGWNMENTALIEALISAYQPDASADQVRAMAADRRASCSAEVENLYRDGMNNNSIAQQLGNVRAPTLVLHSRGDAVHPLAEARKMASGISGAELVVLESRNHTVMPHEPAWATQQAAIAAFVADA